MKKRLCAVLLALTMILSTYVVAFGGPSGTPWPIPCESPAHLNMYVVAFDGGPCGGPPPPPLY